MRPSALTLYRPTRTPDGEGGWIQTLANPRLFYGAIRVYMDRTELTCRAVADVRPEDVIQVGQQPPWLPVGANVGLEAYYRVIGQTSVPGGPMKTMNVEAIEKPIFPAVREVLPDTTTIVLTTTTLAETTTEAETTTPEGTTTPEVTTTTSPNPPAYTVIVAGLFAPVGDYYEFGVSDGVPNFIHETHCCYIYRGELGGMKEWYINDVLDVTNHGNVSYGKTNPGDTPYIGTYGDFGNGVLPAAIVIEGPMALTSTTGAP